MSRTHSAPPTLGLRLYVAGAAASSARAIANATAICREHFASRHRLEIVDVTWHPQRALADGVVVTPTLLKVRPEPVQRLVGDLSDTMRVLQTLSAD
jgi:circadian clock protein KaiB